MPLLPALTLSAGEYKVSGGELKAEWTEWACLAIHALVARIPK